MGRKIVAYFDNELDADKAAGALVERGIEPANTEVINPNQPGVIDDDKVQPDATYGRPEERDDVLPPALGASLGAMGSGNMDGKPGLAPLVDNRNSLGISGARARDLLLGAGVPEEEVEFFSQALVKSGVVVVVEVAGEEEATVEQIFKEMNGRTAATNA
jgi:hypothetical protein